MTGLLGALFILFLFWLFGQSDKPRKIDKLPPSMSKKDYDDYHDNRKFEAESGMTSGR
jgi:hypothetical protein